MRIAVMSDVHANPAALRAALADAREQNCDRSIFLGDVTGYGYDVKTALELVRANFDVSLLGNHDSVLLGRESPLLVMMCPNYDVDIQQRPQLTDEQKDWLGQHPFVHREAGAVFTHGDVTAPDEWRYILDERAAVRNFAAVGDRIIFCGHSHHAEIWEQTPLGRVLAQFAAKLEIPAVEPETVALTLEEGHRYIINVGSVGNPRNDFCTVYGIYEPEAKRVILRRLPFDFADYLMRLADHGVEPPKWLLELSRFIGGH